MPRQNKIGVTKDFKHLMLRITPISSAEQALKYYVQRSNLETYYCDNQEFNGYWGGRGAEMLGLTGYMSNEAFARLIRNQHPLTGEQLTPRMRSDRRPGFDVTFDCPKSVSLAYGILKDERIVQAYRRAVWDTRDEMEAEAATRVRANKGANADENRLTGNWVTAEIIHLTARPEDGVCDPHLHTHLVVFNLTLDPVEKKWKALQMGCIHEEAPYYQAAFHRRLKANLEALGLVTVPTAECFEIEGIERETIEKFSRRTMKIEETAKRLGITDPAQKARLGAMTREKKDKSLRMSELEAIWEGCLTETEKEAFKGLKSVLQRSYASELSQQMTSARIERLADALGTRQELPQPKETPDSSDALGTKRRPQAARTQRRQSMNQLTTPRSAAVVNGEPTEHDCRAVALAMEHLFQRESVVTEKKLLGEALNHWCFDRATVHGVKQVVVSTPLLRQVHNGRVYVTTPEILAQEKRVAALCLSGKEQLEPVNEFWKIRDERLNEGQRRAVLHALNSRDFITGLAGVAGSGKTTIMHEIKQGIEAALYKTVVLAPLTTTAYDTLRKDGFEKAETIAKFLRSESLQRQARGAVLLVDEAGLISTKLADEFLQVAKQLNARVIFIGDSGQHHSVERGRAFQHLRDRGEMAVADVEEILRQQGHYKQFVEMCVAGETRRAVTALWSTGSLVQQPLDELAKTLADDYVRIIEQGKTALVVSPTHAEGQCLTEAIRDQLKEKRRLTGKSVTWDILKPMPMTPAQKSAPEHYQLGQIVQINDHVKGFALGERMEIIGVREDSVRVRSHSGTYHPRIKELPLAQPETFSVYERDQIEVCAGDSLRMTGNGYTADDHRLNNGTVHRVDYIAHDGQLVLENGWHIDREFPHFAHGYVLTSYAAQGKTVDWVFACQTRQLSEAATNREQYHVATTRGREGMITYTDDFEWLKDSVSQSPECLMATELMECSAEKTVAQDARLCRMEAGHAQREVAEQQGQIIGEMQTDQLDERRCELESFAATRDLTEYNRQFAEASKPPLSAVLGQAQAVDMQRELERLRRERELRQAQEISLAMGL
jgi:conjugative relaxase-like TrwC/TraI family protein